MAGVGLVQGVEPRAGEQLAQQARGLGGLAELDVDLRRPQPGLRVVGVDLAPAAIGVERALRLVLLARERRLDLYDRRLVRRRLARRAHRAFGGAQVAVLERLPGVVDEPFQLRVECLVLGHAATVPRRAAAAPPLPPCRRTRTRPPRAPARFAPRLTPRGRLAGRLDDDLVTDLARSLGDARLGGSGLLEVAHGVERSDDRRQDAMPHEGPDRRGGLSSRRRPVDGERPAALV